MDRCRCDEYAEAVKKLKFYTVGTYRPDDIENYDRSCYVTHYVKMGISYCDMRFEKPRVWRVVPPFVQRQEELSPESWQIDQMWCPYRKVEPKIMK